MTSQEQELTETSTRLCDRLITVERAVHLLTRIADTPAPSGASSITRGKQVAAWFREENLAAAGVEISLDHRRSGCDLISSGTGGLRMLAHLDEISYLVEGPTASQGLWPVTAYCYHLAEGPAPARVLRFSGDGTWQVTDRGQILEKDGRLYYQASSDVELRPGDRVCLASDLQFDGESGLVTGSLDNAAGVVAALMAAAVLGQMQIPFSVVLSDEEEGPSGASSQTISRGALRYYHSAADAPLTVAIDIHGVPDADQEAVRGHTVPWGASLAEFSSHGRGSVAPPQLYAAASEYLSAHPLLALGVRANIGGYVPRSDDVVAMTKTNRVLILGYPGINRHFDRGLPSANIYDLMELARSLVALAIGVTTKRVAVDW